MIIFMIIKIVHQVKSHVSKQYFVFGILLIYVFFISCSNGNQKSYTDTPTTGKINIYVDETFKPIIESEVSVFEGIYHYAKINAIYKPEVDVINALLKDTTRLVVISRKLTKEETDFFKSKTFYPKEIKIATDGIAIIVNKNNIDTMLTMKNIKAILSGDITSWKQLNKNSKLQNIKVVFDNKKSSTVRFVVDSICKGSKISKYLSAMEYNTDVVDYVSKEPNALGIIGVSWICNSRDSVSMSFLDKVNVVRLTNQDEVKFSNSCQPYQYYISKGIYPLTRSIYVINSEPRVGLATGFASFLASYRGQLIIYKAGILPATQPVRVVEITDEPYLK